MIYIKYCNEIHATFDLFNAKLGSYNLIVEIPSPSDTVMIIQKAFEVLHQEIINNDIIVNIERVGPSVVRLNNWTDYSVIISNNSYVNAYCVPVWLAFPQYIEFESNFPIQTSGNVYDSVSQSFQEESINGSNGPYQVFPYYIPNVPAKSSITLPIKLKHTNSSVPDVSLCPLEHAESELYGFKLIPPALDCICKSFMLCDLLLSFSGIANNANKGQVNPINQMTSIASATKDPDAGSLKSTAEKINNINQEVDCIKNFKDLLTLSTVYFL